MSATTSFALVIPLVIAGAVLAGDSATPPHSPREHPGYSWPVAPGCTQYGRTHSNFGEKVRERKDGSLRPHLGIDLIPPEGDLHVYVARQGVVVTNSPARRSGWGNYVVIRHADGLRTLYAHLVEPSKLNVGATVQKGDVVGIAGKTETFYLHVHFEIHGEARKDWTRGRHDPGVVIGELDGCRISAARSSDRE